MRYAALALAAAVLAGATSPAAAQSAGDVADTRCIMVLQAVSRDPAQRESAARGVFYYMGRVASRGPLPRIEAIMAAQGKTMNTPQAVQAELTRCGAELSQRGAEIQAVNQNLVKRFGPPPAAAPAKK
ncbi:MAG: hypothetical protein EPO51_05965 [Phenylobacterium sp.]|uniref:hypothetical protein n=1 Tax=Phenylobacterium sp. TaxID=1871053 RepID=UPI0011FB7E42|nr:hypothetical protein [Phenylobacterium sp.]TAJ73181.1 MAG: hypothetical protein EPO51_05965 [Phenylobacterium sp.]